MSKVTKISIALTTELNELVQNAVSSGSYASASEVVREALRDWEKIQESRLLLDHELLRLWNEGLSSGPGRYNSMDEIIAESKRRLALKKSA